jgi:hypothetical protein
MTILFVLLFIVITFSIYLFFAPIFLEINSLTGLYRLRLHYFGSLNFLLKNESIIMEVKILRWKKYIDLLEVNFFSPKKTPKRVSKKSASISLKKIKAIVKSFKINNFEMSICFADMPTNGILYPVFYLLGFYLKKKIAINFIEENKIIIEVKNNLARMSWAYLSS